jgi:hypothetical protein
MIGNWKRWEPIRNLQRKYYIVSVINIEEELSVILAAENNKNKVQVLFKRAASYLLVDEGLRIRLIGLLDIQYGTTFYGDWTFFKVTNSLYLKWLSEESYGISDSPKLIHFSLIASDSIIDIISHEEPLVTIITGESP